MCYELSRCTKLHVLAICLKHDHRRFLAASTKFVAFSASWGHMLTSWYPGHLLWFQLKQHLQSAADEGSIRCSSDRTDTWWIKAPPIFGLLVVKRVWESSLPKRFMGGVKPDLRPARWIVHSPQVRRRPSCDFGWIGKWSNPR
jgi:hypothetical protein